MLIPFAKLKDTALLVSNILRDFDPETMFWREDSPILFPNYDKDGFTPYKRVRKPFSVQIILESFSRSCGYKSYNALLADQHRLEILDVHLNDLNPAPRNAYYTEYWNTFINTMLQSIYTGIVNKTIPSYLTYRNFIYADVNNRMAFIGLSLNAICEVGGTKKFDFDFIPYYYTIALSILMSALQIVRHKVDVLPESPVQIRPEFPGYLINEIEEIEHSWIVPDVPLKQFLIHKKWHEENFTQFKTNLMIAMHEIFGVSLSIVEQNDNPLDSLVSLVMPYDFYSLYKHGIQMNDLHKKLQTYVIDKTHDYAVANDQGYYINNDCKAITATRSDFKPKEFAWNVQQGFKKAKNKHIDHQAIYGNKAFWLNQCCHLFTPRPEHMLFWNNDTIEECMDLMLGQLQAYKEPVAIKRQHEYQFEIQGISQFIKNTGNIFNIKDIPKRITVYADDLFMPSQPSVAKMAVHAKIVALLKDSLDYSYDTFDIHNKYFGDQNIIEFEALQQHQQNPKLKIKEIKYENLNQKKSDLSFDLNYGDLIYSLSVERISDAAIQQLELKPYPNKIHSMRDVFDFDQYEGNFEDLIFTQGIKDQAYYCNLSLSLFEVPYNTKTRYKSEEDWHVCELCCKLSSLNPDKLEILDLWLPYTDKNADEDYRCPGFWEFLPLLKKSPEFLRLMRDYLKWLKVEWTNFNSLISDTKNHEHRFDDLLSYITFHPNGVSYY